jgi:membrane-associated phospholipid phosphatase
VIVTRDGRIGAAGGAIICLALFLALGTFVIRNGEPSGLLDIEHALLNHSSLIAWWLTWMGYAYVLGPACLALIVVAWRFPEWRGRVVFGIAVLLAAWLGADFFQHHFARPRRLDWVVKHETAFSYPSSHAAVAVGFYLLWAEIVRRSEIPGPARWCVAAALALIGCGILWARLALGAHYATDLIGGSLWALVVICAGLAAVGTKVLSPSRGRQ